MGLLKQNTERQKKSAAAAEHRHSHSLEINPHTEGRREERECDLGRGPTTQRVILGEVALSRGTVEQKIAVLYHPL